VPAVRGPGEGTCGIRSLSDATFMPPATSCRGGVHARGRASTGTRPERGPAAWCQRRVTPGKHDAAWPHAEVGTERTESIKHACRFPLRGLQGRESR
jgi:hypothetical protein